MQNQQVWTRAVVTANYYGFGDTEREALDNCKAAGGFDTLMEQGYLLFKFGQPLRMTVDDLGRLQWETTDGSDAPQPLEVEDNRIRT